MLKITAIGNLTNDVELKVSETTGKPYAILRIASDRRYRDRTATSLPLTLSPSRYAALWRNAVQSLPGRAASWLLQATSRPSPLRMTLTASPVS